MDLAYDHIQGESYVEAATKPEQESTLNADIQDAYRAFSASPWGSKIGGFLGNVVKQGGNVYTQAQQELTQVGQELTAVGEEATKGLSDLRENIISRTRTLSINTVQPSISRSVAPAGESIEEDSQTTPTGSKSKTLESEETMLSRLQKEAAKRLQTIQKAEDAADEALLKFGSNVRNFLRDAITIAPPSEDAEKTNKVLFESKDAQGKRIIHASRYDAQLHVVHTSLESFAKDQPGEEFAAWIKEFDVGAKTADISSDLATYPELRETMEKLVPDQVTYKDFWTRYYFIRRGIETAEARRRDLLKAASAEDEVGWDDDSEDDSEEESGEEEEEEDDEEDDDSDDDSEKKKTVAAGEKPTPTSVAAKTAENKTPARPSSADSSTTLHAKTSTAKPQAKPAAAKTPVAAVSAAAVAKPAEARKSNDEKSLADSDASYDVVGGASGVASKAPNSPKKAKDDESDDEDWE